MRNIYEDAEHPHLETGKLADKNAVFLAFIAKEVQPYLDKKDSWDKDLAEAKINQMLMTMRWDNTLGFLGGKVDQDETLEEALLREIKEEAGVELSDEEISKLEPFCTHAINEMFNSHLFVLEVDLERLRQIQRGSMNGEDFYAESAGLVLVHIHEKSINNLLKSSLAKTVKEELRLLL